MKQQKILTVVVIVLLVGVIAIQLFVKNKVKIVNGEGETGVFLRGTPAEEETETLIEA